MKPNFKVFVAEGAVVVVAPGVVDVGWVVVGCSSRRRGSVGGWSSVE